MIHRAKQLKPSDPRYIHINCLEFAVVILQLAATIVLFQDAAPGALAQHFPNGVPAYPILLSWTDNTASKGWANKVTTRSKRGQYLLGIYAKLLHLHDVGINCDHIAGEKNILADFISRPTHFGLSHAQQAEQIFQQHSFMRTWSYFLPSPDFLQNLRCNLLAEPWPGRPKIPKTLEQFVIAGYTIGTSPSL